MQVVGHVLEHFRLHLRRQLCIQACLAIMCSLVPQEIVCSAGQSESIGLLQTNPSACINEH